MRPAISSALLGGLCALVLAACASKPPAPQKFTVQGFSFELPAKDAWALVQQSPDLVLLGKTGDFTGEALSIQMAAVRLAPVTGEDLARHVRETERQALDPKRFRVFSHEVRPHSIGSLNCVLSSLEAEDRSPAGPTGPVMSLNMESLTVTCPDPGKPTQGVSLAYVHVSYPEDKGRNFADKAPQVLNSLTFEQPH